MTIDVRWADKLVRSVTVPLTQALAPLELILKLTEQHRISTPLGNINTLHSHRPLKPPDLPLQKHNGRRRLWHTLRADWRAGLERGRRCLDAALLAAATAAATAAWKELPSASTVAASAPPPRPPSPAPSPPPPPPPP
eukprot:CAMPEP_0181198036 /NCGR_PEP_ID=MMETSP1096-20121128/16385_1 /TAXON_ID=156174 ORGANISM="Chrysochromulina ericina, Strain CCMP281" /NCGR_SAMPLE_ID=MMETSP1096 /ASSEMBLY_ACC=CAM_ASM_000453 /LENGTH=137 /DNA_ID=CAMNT_0023288037 /DNA_START=175 /DNA_END=585 /DNA_ORIENTATION=-